MGLRLYFWLFHGLPSPNEFSLYAIANGACNYAPVSLSEIPNEFRWATIASEDRDFYARPSNIDPHAVARGIWLNLQRDKYIVDGHAITQRLVTNLMAASGEPTNDLQRYRMRQLALVVLITQRYTKDEILGFYLNSVYYGAGVYGANDAARFYYGKHISDLSLAECAMLVYISHCSRVPDFDVIGDWEKAKQGQADVLSMMVHAGYIDTEKARAAIEEPLVFVPK